MVFFKKTTDNQIKMSLKVEYLENQSIQILKNVFVIVHENEYYKTYFCSS